MGSVFLANVNNVDWPIIENILVKNKINFFIKDLHESSLHAGWFSPGVSFNERMLFVNTKQFNRAKSLLMTYISDNYD